MNAFQSIAAWGDEHHPKWLDVLRVMLGILLFAKGLSFIMNKELVAEVLKANNFDFLPVLVMHYVIIFQMAHSVLIAIGLITRIAILAQLPIVVGALLLLWTREEFSVFSSDIWLAVLIVFLLVFFFIYGPGTFSVDNYLKRAKES